MVGLSVHQATRFVLLFLFAFSPGVLVCVGVSTGVVLPLDAD